MNTYKEDADARAEEYNKRLKEAVANDDYEYIGRDSIRVNVPAPLEPKKSKYPTKEELKDIQEKIDLIDKLDGDTIKRLAEFGSKAEPKEERCIYCDPSGQTYASGSCKCGLGRGIYKVEPTPPSQIEEELFIRAIDYERFPTHYLEPEQGVVTIKFFDGTAGGDRCSEGTKLIVVMNLINKKLRAINKLTKEK